MSWKVDFERAAREEAAQKARAGAPNTSLTPKERCQGWEEVTLGEQTSEHPSP